jgi:hypothetical protein
MPAAGMWEIDTPLTTIWHGEQTGGILTPFLKFLLIAKNVPGLISADTATAWQSKIVSIASEYEDQFVSDGDGGLVIKNAQWMPDTEAGLVTESDYVYAEAICRILLYELTSDSHQLSIAEGLVRHNLNHTWQTNQEGWLLLKNWPDIVPWSSRSGAPEGAIWDSLTYDPASPELTSAGIYFNDLLSIAAGYGLSGQLGLSSSLHNEDQQTLDGYILISATDNGALLRNNYPTANSSSSDAIDANPDLYANMAFLDPGGVDTSFVLENWNSMLKFGSSPQGDPNGYFLLAWARSEAAMNSTCSSTP